MTVIKHEIDEVEGLREELDDLQARLVAAETEVERLANESSGQARIYNHGPVTVPAGESVGFSELPGEPGSGGDYAVVGWGFSVHGEPPPPDVRVTAAIPTTGKLAISAHNYGEIDAEVTFYGVCFRRTPGPLE